MNKLKKLGFKALATGAVLAASAGSAFADVDTKGLTDSVGDVGTIGAAVLAILVAAAGFKFVRKAL
jgi:hypothetical protein